MRHTLLGDHSSVSATKLRLFEAEKGVGAGGGGKDAGKGKEEGGGEGENEGDGEEEGDGEDLLDDSDSDSGKGSPGGTKSASQADDAKAKKLAKENKSLRTRLRALEAAEDERKRSELSEADRLKLDATNAKTAADKAKQELQEERATMTVERAARKLGLDEELAGRLVRFSDLEFDDDGKVTNAEELLEELVAKHPRLKNSAGAADDDEETKDTKRKTPLGPTNADRSKTRGKVFTREQVMAMSPEEINANWEAVAPLLQAGALNTTKR